MSDSEDEKVIATETQEESKTEEPVKKTDSEADSPEKESSKSDKKETEESKPPLQSRVFPFIPHDKMPPLTKPLEVVYCPTTGFPPEYASYSPDWEIAKPWILENFPECYPELAGSDLAALSATAKEKKDELDKKKADGQLLPGGKKKKTNTSETADIIKVKVQKRQGKKMVTSIMNLDSPSIITKDNPDGSNPIGIKLEAAAKVFKKKFACGSAVIKAQAGQPEYIEIQGDPGESEIVALLKKEWGIDSKTLKKLEFQDMS